MGLDRSFTWLAKPVSLKCLFSFQLQRCLGGFWANFRTIKSCVKDDSSSKVLVGMDRFMWYPTERRTAPLAFWRRTDGPLCRFPCFKNADGKGRLGKTYRCLPPTRRKERIVKQRSGPGEALLFSNFIFRLLLNLSGNLCWVRCSSLYEI